MSEFKQKLKHLLSPKDNNDKIFNNSLSKIHKRIKRENSTKLLHPKLNIKSYYSKYYYIINNSTNKNELNNNIEKRNLNKFSLLKLRKSKSTNNLINIMRSFSINDIHTNDNKIAYNFNSINKFKSSNHIKRFNYNINNKINYFEPIMNNPYKTFINNKTIKNDIYSTDSIINNNLFSFKETINRSNIKINSTIIYKNNNLKNTFRIRNNYENNNKKYITNIPKSNFIRYNLLNKRKNKLLKL